MKNDFLCLFKLREQRAKVCVCMVPWRLPCPHLTHHTQNCSDHIHEQKGFAQIIHDMEEQFGSFQRSRASGKDGIGISGYKCQKNQNNETEQPPSHIYLADLAVIRHPFSAGDPQCLDTTKAHTDQCPNQIDSLGIILFLNYAGVEPGSPVAQKFCAIRRVDKAIRATQIHWITR